MKIEFKHIGKTYGSVRALSDFSVELTPGIYALLGPNGAGKTTLMHILTDNLKADSGEILYTEDGNAPRNVKAMGEEFREMLGFMPQYSGMYPNFTAKQFLQYAATLKGVGDHLKKHERYVLIDRQITEILDELELSDVAMRRIGTFSGGMKQRLALAQAVLGNPKILILDEPTAGLDPKQRIAVRNYVSRISRDKIVLIATHMVSDIECIAKEIILLRKGETVNMAAPHVLVQEIDGKVWDVCVEQDRIAEMQSKFAVTNIATSDEQAGMAVLRVLSDTKPSEDATHAVPALEDYYLYVFGKQ